MKGPVLSSVFSAVRQTINEAFSHSTDETYKTFRLYSLRLTDLRTVAIVPIMRTTWILFTVGLRERGKTVSLI